MHENRERIREFGDKSREEGQRDRARVRDSRDAIPGERAAQ